MYLSDMVSFNLSAFLEHYFQADLSKLTLSVVTARYLSTSVVLLHPQLRWESMGLTLTCSPRHERYTAPHVEPAFVDIKYHACRVHVLHWECQHTRRISWSLHDCALWHEISRFLRLTSQSSQWSISKWSIYINYHNPVYCFTWRTSLQFIITTITKTIGYFVYKKHIMILISVYIFIEM